MRIAIDLDNVLADTSRSTLQRYNTLNHTDYRISDWVTWGTGPWHTVEELEAAFTEQWMHRPWDIDECEPNAALAIEKLSDMGHEITILTKRDYTNHTEVVWWLHWKHIYYDALIMASGNRKLDYPFDLLVDDNPQLANIDWPKNRILYLRTQPWNTAVDTSRIDAIRRADSLWKVVNDLEKLSYALH